MDVYILVDYAAGDVMVSRFKLIKPNILKFKINMEKSYETCECCERDFDIETMTTNSEDQWFCTECVREIKNDVEVKTMLKEYRLNRIELINLFDQWLKYYKENNDEFMDDEELLNSDTSETVISYVDDFDRYYKKIKSHK